MPTKVTRAESPFHQSGLQPLDRLLEMYTWAVDPGLKLSGPLALKSAAPLAPGRNAFPNRASRHKISMAQTKLPPAMSTTLPAHASFASIFARAIPSDRELILSRLFDAPRERVFAAWTQQLPQWWGPHGMTTPVCEMDLRPGGVFRTVMRAQDGTEYSTRGIFLEVVPPERIAFTDAFDPGWIPRPDAFLPRSPRSKTSGEKPGIRRAPCTGPPRIGSDTSKWASIKGGAKASIASRRS